MIRFRNGGGDLLWDSDGVLVDTECLFFESTRTILDTIGIQLSLRQFLDLSMGEERSAFELAIERVGKTTGRGVQRERDLLYSKMLRKQTRVLPDVSESLQRLQGRMRSPKQAGPSVARQRQPLMP